MALTQEPNKSDQFSIYSYSHARGKMIESTPTEFVNIGL